MPYDDWKTREPEHQGAEPPVLHEPPCPEEANCDVCEKFRTDLATSRAALSVQLDSLSPSKERLQRLFEKLSDAYDGMVEQKNITDSYIDVRFLKNDVDEIGHVRLSFVHVVINNQDENDELVRVVDHYGGEDAYVSNIPSAIIAVSCR